MYSSFDDNMRIVDFGTISRIARVGQNNGDDSTVCTCAYQIFKTSSATGKIGLATKGYCNGSENCGFTTLRIKLLAVIYGRA